MNSIVDLIYENNSRRVPFDGNSRTRDVISFKARMKEKNALNKLAVIAEFKRSSPSGFQNAKSPDMKGYFNTVSRLGITGLSILTEADYFRGSLFDVVEAQYLNMPILVKDFISGRRMIDEAFRAGGDIVLLIADFLNREDIIDMLRYTSDLGMEALLEFHDLENMNKINGAEDAIIGYNRRNLRTMRIEPEEEKVLEELKASSVPLILESGIGPENLDIVRNARFNGLLIGTSILNKSGLLEKMQSMEMI